MRFASLGVSRFCVADLTLRTIRLTRELGLRSSMVPNGYWARTPAEAEDVCGDLEDAGLQKLAVSFDRFHNRIVSGTSLDLLLATGARTSIELQVQYRGDQADEAYRTAEKVAARHGAALATADVLPFGRGRLLTLRRSVDVETVPDDPCGVAVRPVLTQGELFTFCGPARGAAQTSPLRLAIDSPDDVGSALSVGATNPILNLIHSKGPRVLLARLSLPVRERVSKRLLDGSICSLCRAITDDDEAVAELNDVLENDQMRLIALSALMQAAQDELARGQPSVLGGARSHSFGHECRIGGVDDAYRVRGPLASRS